MHRTSMYSKYIEYLGIQPGNGGMNMDRKMMAASTSMLLLKLLEEEDLYGYQMIRRLEARSDNVFSLKEGTMYPVLHALEEEGAVESYEKTAENGRTRKYYHLTKKGQRTLGKKREEWETCEKAVRAVLEGGASFAF